jgi:hypothetical protein
MPLGSPEEILRSNSRVNPTDKMPVNLLAVDRSENSLLLAASNLENGSGGRIRTYDQVINSHLLYH